MACGILVPRPGIEWPLHWKRGVLTTRPPGKSPKIFQFQGHFKKYSGKSHRMTNCLFWQIGTLNKSFTINSQKIGYITWKKLKWILPSKRSQCEKATYHMIPIYAHSGKGKTTGTVKRLVVARWAEEGWISGAQRIFRAVETTLHDTIMVDTCQYTFVQTHRMHKTKSEPWCELRTLGENDV